MKDFRRDGFAYGTFPFPDRIIPILSWSGAASFDGKHVVRTGVIILNGQPILERHYEKPCLFMHAMQDPKLENQDTLLYIEQHSSIVKPLDFCCTVRHAQPQTYLLT